MAIQTPKSLDSKTPITHRPSTAQASSSQAKLFATSNDYRQVFLIDGKQVQLSSAIFIPFFISLFYYKTTGIEIAVEPAVGGGEL